MVFRDGIKPEWTDKMNVDGGRWLLEIDRQYRNEQLNSKWLETLLAIIGEYDDQSIRINFDLQVRPWRPMINARFVEQLFNHDAALTVSACGPVMPMISTQYGKSAKHTEVS